MRIPSLYFSPFWHKKTSDFSNVHYKKYYNFSVSNMITSDLDYSERRTEEVLGFFWRSMLIG